MQEATTFDHGVRLKRAPKLRHLDPSSITNLGASDWKRSKTLTYVDEGGRETNIRIRKSRFLRDGEMKVADIGCRFDVDGQVVGFCEMAAFRAPTFTLPSECYPEMDGHSEDGRKLNLLLQARFRHDILDYGTIVVLRRIQFLPSGRPGAWVKPFDYMLDQLFCADEWSFMIGTPYPLEYEAHQSDEEGCPRAFERRREALSRFYANRVGFQRLRNEGDEWVWRPIGPRCSVELLRNLIVQPHVAASSDDPRRAATTMGSEEIVNDFDARP